MHFINKSNKFYNNEGRVSLPKDSSFDFNLAFGYFITIGIIGISDVLPSSMTFVSISLILFVLITFISIIHKVRCRWRWPGLSFINFSIAVLIVFIFLFLNVYFYFKQMYGEITENLSLYFFKIIYLVNDALVSNINMLFENNKNAVGGVLFLFILIFLILQNLSIVTLSKSKFKSYCQYK